MGERPRHHTDPLPPELVEQMANALSFVVRGIQRGELELRGENSERTFKAADDALSAFRVWLGGRAEGR